MDTNLTNNPFDPDGEVPLSREEILAHLNTERIGHQLIVLESVDSTNSFLSRERGRLEDGAVATADHQSTGKGRHGRQWVSPPRKNLMFSLLVRPPFPYPAIATLIGALSVIRAGNQSGAGVALKWPNDIVSNSPNDEGFDRKVGGVLCEPKNDLEGNPLLILGIGINVNSLPEDFPEEVRQRATTLRFLTGERWERSHLLAQILNNIDRLWKVAEVEGNEAIVKEARSLCSTLAKRVQLKIGNQEIEGEAIDLDSTGRLLLRDESGRVHPVELGEVIRTRRIT